MRAVDRAKTAFDGTLMRQNNVSVQNHQIKPIRIWTNVIRRYRAKANF